MAQLDRQQPLRTHARASRASERTKREKKTWQVLEGNYRGDNFTPVSFREVCSFNLAVPAFYSTELNLQKKRLFPIRDHKSRFAFHFERNPNLKVSFQVCITRSSVTSMEKISLMEGMSRKYLFL